MRRILYILPFIVLLLLWSSCRKDFNFQDSTGNLVFSRDTVFLDTIFSTIGSSTRSLMVYNPTNSDINIPNVRLAKGLSSNYRLNVDGEAGKEFFNVPLLAKDSLFVFIETTVNLEDPNVNTLLDTDAILFHASSNMIQQVTLVTLVKKAILLFPGQQTNGDTESILLGTDEAGNEIRTAGFELQDDELNFTNTLPYVIYGYAKIPSGKALQVDAGARVHFHKDSGILVAAGASLHVNGNSSIDTLALENEVIFEGDRLEPDFANVDGQWGGLWFAKGSAANRITHLTLKNARIGIFMDGDGNFNQAHLALKNTQIYNSTLANLWASNSRITAENLLLGSAGGPSLRCELGGTYQFYHSTIANYWSRGFRSTAAVQLSNQGEDSFGQLQTADLIQAQFTNCIIAGSKNQELQLQADANALFNFNFSHCLLQFEDSGNQLTNNALYDFENSPSYYKMWFNTETGFKDARNGDFRINELSTAVNNAQIDTVLLVPKDILGRDRTNMPDIGAYIRCIQDPF